MTATLPSELRDVFERSSTAELVTIDAHGRPVARSVTASYRQGHVCIDVAAAEALAGDPHVALLFTADGPTVLVQGTAQADAVLHVRPERVFAWPAGDPDAEPQLFDAHLEEVRSGHNEEPEVPHAAPEGGAGVWDERLDGLGEALLACVAPDGFPFAALLAIRPDAGDGVLRFGALPVGMPAEPGPVCVHAQGGPRVHGDLMARADGWALVPHAVLGD